MKKQSIILRGPLEAYPNVEAYRRLGFLNSSPMAMTVWRCIETKNSLRLDLGQFVARPELSDLVELDPADVTIRPALQNAGMVYVTAQEWTRLGGVQGPGPDGERPSERAMRLSEGKTAEPASG